MDLQKVEVMEERSYGTDSGLDIHLGSGGAGAGGGGRSYDLGDFGQSGGNGGG